MLEVSFSVSVSAQAANGMGHLALSQSAEILSSVLTGLFSLLHCTISLIISCWEFLGFQRNV